jgi:alpha-beta hydrolase superfamily lysophospholipase
VRRVLGLLCLLLLAGCAAPGLDDGAAPLVSGDPPAAPATPELTGHELIAADGAHLPLRVWLPSGEITAVILALHGFNDYSNAFAMPAADLARRSIATYAYDQRGFGEAPLRGRWAGQRQLATDLVTASRLLRARYPGVPLYLLGESMGGAVVAVAMAGTAGTPRPEADGVILSAPAVWGRPTMTVFERVALWLSVRLLPSQVVTGQGIVRVTPSDNIAMLRALSADPLVIKGARVDAIYGLVDLMDTALAAAPRLDMPLLYLYGEHDEIVPRQPTEAMIAHLPPAAHAVQRVAWYANGYHMLTRDLDGAVVTGDIASWITRHQAALPSGADRHAASVLGPEFLAKAN